MRWLMGVVLTVTACGRIAFDPLDDGGGSAAGDARRPDANYSQRRWQQRFDNAPGPFFGARMVYDAARGTVIMYGGEHLAVPSAAMWELTAAGWQSLCNPCAPGARSRPGLGYDPDRDRIVLYGGIGPPYYGDHWEWDGVTWTEISAAAAPSIRAFTTMVYDTALHAMLLVGGGDGGGTNDARIWRLDNGVWTQVATTGGFPVLFTSGHPLAYDPTRQRILAEYDDGTNLRDEMWTWNGTWTQLCTTCTGLLHYSSSLAYDPVLDTYYIVGAYGAEGTWRYDGAKFQRLSTDPIGRDALALAYDAARDVFVAYGGNGNGCAGGAGGDCDETWELVPDR